MNDHEPALRLDHVSRAFGPVSVLDDLSLTIEKGEFVVLVGPSGCGKTTLLNILSGALPPSSGSVEKHGILRTVYQQDGLFPWLTVRDNIALGLRQMTDKGAKAYDLAEMLSLVRLEEFADHYPHQLSGGMRQRVQIARALAGQSDVLLLDEPFSALDYQARLRLRRELARLLAQRPRTVVFVTHDIEEAAQLADRVLVLTERPAHVLTELRLETPRPRELSQPEVIEAMERIIRDLGLSEPERDLQALNAE